MKNKTKNKKFIQLTKTAHEVLMLHGIRRITVEEICREANISKMTFYKHFKNKTDLAKYMLTELFTQGMNEYRNLMSKEVSFAEKVKLIIELKQTQTQMYTQEFFNDLFKNPDPEILGLISKMTTDSQKEVLSDLKAAQAKGEIRQDINPEFILYLLNSTTEMAKDENLLKHYRSHTELIMELTNFFFYGIMPVNDRPEV